MIIVTVELHSARTGQTTLLGKAKIWNDLGQHRESGGTIGSYKAVFCGKRGRFWKEGTVRDFPRKRLLAWDLIFRALRNIIGERNEEKELHRDVER